MILDACCGPRSFWFDRQDTRAVFVDRRSGEFPIDVDTPGTVGRKPIVVRPDVKADFAALPFRDSAFDGVVMDPPHVARLEACGAVTRRYGVLFPGWRENLTFGMEECFRVLAPGGLLIFKWSSTEIPVDEVISMSPHPPLFGHRSGRKMKTHWLVFQKPKER